MLDVETLSAADALGATRPRHTANRETMAQAARRVRTAVKAQSLSPGLGLLWAGRVYNPTRCPIIAETLRMMLTPWTPDSTLRHLNLWRA
jgi:hypothetical protein